MNRLFYAFAGIVFGWGSAAGAADNWPSWRGPAYNGVCDAVNVPTAWSATDNVAWKLPLPGPSGSTPAVWDDRIFVTTTSEGKNLVLCIDRSGKMLWQKAVGDERKGKHDRKGSGAHPSPTTDGTHVFVYYRSGDLACLDFQGNIVWEKNLQKLYGPDTLWWDMGTSPVLTKAHVVVAVIHDKPAFLLAFDKATGRLAWKQDRSLDAPREANQSYTTPIVYTEGDRQTLFILGADHITAHDAADGKEIWRVGGLNPNGQGFFRCIASPVVSDGILVAPYARGKTRPFVSAVPAISPRPTWPGFATTSRPTSLPWPPKTAVSMCSPIAANSPAWISKPARPCGPGNWPTAKRPSAHHRFWWMAKFT
jgi:outer membrane protein assembly factor BamB